ncbi:helix-turn-helix domain-containing protein [Pseudomonas putida]|uniref:helix-turn-helix domain-containing protein n=1 Tax=Pseudomonas putida TaxID=303 RepID=UPI00035E1434|nr:helix-turn-helix transcriptional regulator [Pseudomonas putida]
MSNEFAMNLVYLRGEKNLTQQQLGDAIGVSPSQISRYEAGQAMPRKTVMRKLADVLGVSVEQLSKPDMVNIVMDEPSPGGSDDTWEITVPKHLVSKIQASADEFGVSLEVMFVAQLERARLFWEEGVDPGLEKAIESVQRYHKSIE